MDTDPKFDLNKWTSRMLAGMLEFTILYVLQHYQGEHYPDSIKKNLIVVDPIWENIKTPTLYSKIKKLEEFNLIETHHGIIKAKLKKSMKITSAGRDLLPDLRKRVKQHLKAFKFDDELLNGVK